jgi:hypothetical protein
LSAPLLVADFELGDARPSAREFVEAAAARGAQFVVADVEEGDDDSVEARRDGRLVAGLARLADEAWRRQVGLFLRLSDTRALAGLRDALDVEKGAKVAALRDRVLVVVPGERVGKRLRRDVPEIPSALELSTAGRGLSRFLPANYRRAAADADDLVVPWDGPNAPALVAKVAPVLAKRGARLWVSNLKPEELDDASALPVAGLVARFSFP